MGYQIMFSDVLAHPTPLVVPDKELNNDTSLVFIGREYYGYGPIISENFLHLLENFASTTAPTKPIQGQLWYDINTDKNILKVYDEENNWVPVTGIIKSTNEPDEPHYLGDVWYDLTLDKLKMWTGSDWLVIGPTDIDIPIVKEIVLDVNNIPHYILRAIVDNKTIFTISNDAFTLLHSIDNGAFTKIYQGITLTNSASGTTSTDYRFTGTATNSEKLNDILASQYQLKNNYTTATAGTNTTAPATTAFVQTAIGGVVSSSDEINLASGNHTLTKVEAGKGIIKFKGAISTNKTVTISTSLPNKVLPRSWVIYNNTTTSNDSKVFMVETVNNSSIELPRDVACHVIYDGNTVSKVIPDSSITQASYDNSDHIATTEFVQNAIGGSTNIISLTHGVEDLSITQAGYGIIKFTGNLSGDCTITIPDTAPNNTSLPRSWIVYNNTDDSYNVYLVPYTQRNDADKKVRILKDLATHVAFDGTNIKIVNEQATAQTAAQFDNDSSVATTEFVQRALGNLQGILVANTEAEFQLELADAGKLIKCGYAYPVSNVINLPSAEILAEKHFGIQYFFHNVGTDSTLAHVPDFTSASYITINGEVKTNIPIAPGENLVLTLFKNTEDDRFVWYASGSAVYKSVQGPFPCSKGATGYQKLPTGLIIQWGVGASNPNGTIDTVFPIAFPTAVTACVISEAHPVGGSWSLSNTPTLHATDLPAMNNNLGHIYGFSLIASNGAFIPVEAAFNYIAIGY